MNFELIPGNIKFYRNGNMVVSNLDSRNDTLPSVCGAILMYEVDLPEHVRTSNKYYKRCTVTNILRGVDNAIEHGDKYYPEELDNILSQLRLSEVTSVIYTDETGKPLKAKQFALMKKATALVRNWILMHKISQELLHEGYEMTLKALKEASDRFPEDMDTQCGGLWGRVFYRVKCKPKKLDGWLKRVVVLTIIGVMFKFGPTPLLDNPEEFIAAFDKFLERNPEASYELQAEWIYNALVAKKYFGQDPQ